MFESVTILLKAQLRESSLRPRAADRHPHLANRVDPRNHGVARLDRAHTFRSAGIEHVAGIEGIEARVPTTMKRRP
jgi:hypothetical protein